tara:strand:- start:74 stop:433 length:360 start_codon:yes stop_codon:yes gene_type:complete
MDNFQWVIIGMLVIWFTIVLFFIYMHTEQQVKSRRKKMKISLLKSLVRNRKLTPMERLSSRIGYMGVGFLIAAQWTISPYLYILGFLCVLIQTAVRKQWNLVALQINGLIAWIIHLIVY